MMGKLLKMTEIPILLIPPYASLIAGVSERKVGAVKIVFNSAIVAAKQTFFLRDEFSTLLQEPASIVNHNTPYCEVSNNPTEPLPVFKYMYSAFYSSEFARTA